MSPVKIIPCEKFSDRRFILGEGPGYDLQNDTAFWVDIKTGSLFLYNCGNGKIKEIQTGQYLGAAVPTRTGKYLVALTTGIYYCSEAGVQSFVRPPELNDNLRFNDGKCDPEGRFWFGTIPLFTSAPKGFLFRLDPDGNCRPMLSGINTSNGIAWSMDGKRMYYTDTAEKGTDGFDFDMKKGCISSRRRIIDFAHGYPDGMTIDTEDKLWIALWGDSKVVRCDPKTGKILAEVRLPVTNVSSCAFIGKDLDMLLITTSGENSTGLVEGCIFIAWPGVSGMPSSVFKD